jgi:chemotaxis signal transduction protein
VIVVEFQPDALGPENAARPGPVRLGLVAENVVTVRSTDEATSSLPPVRMPGADYLDRTLRIGGETVQVLDVGKLLPAELAAGFAPARPAEAGP